MQQAPAPVPVQAPTPLPPAKPPVAAPAAPAPKKAAAKPAPAVPKALATMMVNGVPYQALSVVGKGGSSKVYKVMNGENSIFGLKRVEFEDMDQAAIESFMEVHDSTHPKHGSGTPRSSLCGLRSGHSSACVLDSVFVSACIAGNQLAEASDQQKDSRAVH